MLRFCPKVTKPSVSNIWECNLIKGQQVSGLALRRKETATSFHVGESPPVIVHMLKNLFVQVKNISQPLCQFL